MSKTSHLPLSRFRVLDLTRARSGPTAVRQLADWGADVIQIEIPADPDSDGGIGGKRHGPDFQNLHRNKRSMTLNLKDPEGVAIFKQLVKKADVVVENYRPNVKVRLGIDYKALKEVNPKIIYASISGFGQDGPYSSLAGYDQVAQGMGGLMSITGLPGQGPVRAGIPIADLSAGLYLANGILVALLEREVSGEGQWVHTSLLQAQIAMLDFQGTRWLMEKEVPQQAGNYHPTIVPTGVYPTNDGYINFSVAGIKMYERFCEAMGRKDWLEDPKFATLDARYINRDEMNAQIAEITQTRSSAQWLGIYNEAGVPSGPINTIDKVFDDPQVKHLGMAHPVEHPILGTIEILSQPVQLERTPFQMRSASPEAGEHTKEILEQQLDINYDQFLHLQKQGII